MIFFSCVTVVAQEYIYEIGGALGTSAYMGDANKQNPFLEMHPAIGVVFRKNINFRWALKSDLLLGKVSGNTTNFENKYPHNANAAFSRNFLELGFQPEFNFLPYSDKFPYLQTSKIAPYIFPGLGATLAFGEETFVGFNLALGAGVKYKVKNRINLGLEWSVRKLFGDDFDVPYKSEFNLDNPYKLNDGGMKNKDWYTLFLFSVTWDFGPNDRKCSNIE